MAAENENKESHRGQDREIKLPESQLLQMRIKLYLMRHLADVCLDYADVVFDLMECEVHPELDSNRGEKLTREIYDRSFQTAGYIGQVIEDIQSLK